MIKQFNERNCVICSTKLLNSLTISTVTAVLD